MAAIAPAITAVFGMAELERFPAKLNRGFPIVRE
jgi:hypothetical protein